MAARQGITAQISQASEDAKRAVLQRAPLKSSWFSNLNTTCTIKSAPPRTPEVLNLLSTKCGWLIKRNEQHVWQSRWCCVVPHTFLYYFDADIGVGESPPNIPAELQEKLNGAVREGLRGGNTQPRSSLYNVFPTGGGGGGATTPTAELQNQHNDEQVLQQQQQSTPDIDFNDEKFKELTPSGIIDLECYTAVHRSSENQLILELAGDDSVNPDLRSFYFCAHDGPESEEWTQSLLSMRHSALGDEIDAYRQVCDGFSQQLQVLHQQMDEAHLKQEEATEECYRVRSQGEEQRRTAIKVIQEALERDTSTGDNPSPFNNARRSCRTDLEHVKQQDMGILPAVQLLADYAYHIETVGADLHRENQSLQEKMIRVSDGDRHASEKLREEISTKETRWAEEKLLLEKQIDTLQIKLLHSNKSVENSQKDFAAQRMEMSMLQNQTKTKLSELQSHKKILKKEVIELRGKLEEVGSELSVLRHRTKSAKSIVDAEKQKNQVLERYVQKIESQVRVQQNMMEMMSHNASVAGSQQGSFAFSPRGKILEVDTSNNNNNNNNGNNENGNENNEQGDAFASNLGSPITAADNSGGGGGGGGSNVVGSDTAGSLTPINNHNRTKSISSSKERGEWSKDAPPTPEAGSSRRGGVSGSRNNSSSKKQQRQRRRSAQQESPSEEDDDNIVGRGSDKRRSLNLPFMDDDADDKSHVSELTEDRTQRQFDAAFSQQMTLNHHHQMLHNPYTHHHHPHMTPPPHHNPREGGGGGGYSEIQKSYSDVPRSPQLGGRPTTPPSIIIGVANNENNSKDTLPSSTKLTNISSTGGNNPRGLSSTTRIGGANNNTSRPPITGTSSSRPSRTSHHHHHHHHSLARSSSNNSLGGGNDNASNASSGKLSVAQRARMEADAKINQVRVKPPTNALPSSTSNGSVGAPSPAVTRGRMTTIDHTPNSSRGARAPSPARSVGTQGSFFTQLERKITRAIDNSIIGVPDELLTSDDDYTATDNDTKGSTRGEASLGSLTEEHSETEVEHNRGGRPQVEEKKMEDHSTSMMRTRSSRNTTPTTGSHNTTTVSQSTVTPLKSNQHENENLYGGGGMSTPSPMNNHNGTPGSGGGVGKSGGSASGSPSLAERQAALRARQIEFLKKKGLINDESGMRGGAGLDVGSVVSGNSSAVSFTRSLTETIRRSAANNGKSGGGSLVDELSSPSPEKM